MVVSLTELNLESILAQLIAYVLYCGSLSGTVQIVIEQLKPQFITPLKEKMTEAQYLGFMYGVRTIVTALGFFTLWGGVEAAKAWLPSLPYAIPDYGLAFITIALVVLGQEFLHAILDKLYAASEAAKLLAKVVPVGPTSPMITAPVAQGETVTATVTTTEVTTVNNTVEPVALG